LRQLRQALDGEGFNLVVHSASCECARLRPGRCRPRATVSELRAHAGRPTPVKTLGRFDGIRLSSRPFHRALHFGATQHTYTHGRVA